MLVVPLADELTYLDGVIDGEQSDSCLPNRRRIHGQERTATLDRITSYTAICTPQCEDKLPSLLIHVEPLRNTKPVSDSI